MKARIFTGDQVEIPLPAALEFYLTGVKAHDSELRLVAYLIQTLRPGDIVVDAGAHLGYYALCMSHLVGSSGQVIAFEPSQCILPFLLRNVQGREQVRVVQMILSDNSGERTFYEFPVHFSEFNTTQREQSEISGYQSRQVSSTSLDAFFQNSENHPHLIKIDVEGGEFAVLKGAERILPKVSQIAMEVRKPGFDRLYAESVDYLAGFGFTPHMIDTDGSLRPLNDVRRYILGLPAESDNIVFIKRPKA